jgi:succinoglycan biosynthesis protein ExoW
MINVVIPYFQRQPGVLRRALSSVMAQHDCGRRIHVVIVDDGSPVPASAEMTGLQAPANVTWEVIVQSNAGPGAARNRGIEACSNQTQFIAFLDSDDEWTPDHLDRAMAALACGHDWYFANFIQLDQKVGAFERAGRIEFRQHTRLPTTDTDLFTYCGNMTEQIMFANLIGTSTVVYRFSGYQNARFNTAFRSAGEDYLFWLLLSNSGGPIAFSGRIAARYGHGVNVYSGVQWGTGAHLARAQEEIAYRREIQRTIPLNATQLAKLQAIVLTVRKEFASSLVSMLLHLRMPPWRVLMNRYAQQPSDIALLVTALAQKVGIVR